MIHLGANGSNKPIVFIKGRELDSRFSVPDRTPTHPPFKNRYFSDADHSHIEDAVLYESIDQGWRPLCRTRLLTGPAGSPSRGVSENGSGSEAGTS